jgi:hypothetical protein
MKSFFKIVARSVGSISFIAVIIAVIGILTGFLYIGIKQPAQTVANYSTVCDASVIGKYNQLMGAPTKDDAARTEKAKSLQQFIDQTKSKPNFSNDPTCAYMAFSSAILASNQDDAKAQLAIVKRFSEQGIYPNISLIDVMSVDSMQSRIDALTPVKGSANENGRG